MELEQILSSSSDHLLHFSLVYTHNLVCAQHLVYPEQYVHTMAGGRGCMTFKRNSFVTCVTLAEYHIGQTVNHFFNTCIIVLNWYTYCFSSEVPLNYPETWTISTTVYDLYCVTVICETVTFVSCKIK